MAIPFNPISITIGKDGLSSFKSLRIDQSTGAHHHFDLTVDLESGGATDRCITSVVVKSGSAKIS